VPATSAFEETSSQQQHRQFKQHHRNSNNIASANRVSVRQRPCSISSPSLSRVMCVPITIQNARGPALFQVQARTNHVIVRRRPCLISSPSSPLSAQNLPPASAHIQVSVQFQVCLKFVQVSLIFCVRQSRSRVSSQIQVSVQVQICLKLRACHSHSSAPDARICLKFKFVSSCVCANCVPLCLRPCSVSSPSSPLSAQALPPASAHIQVSVQFQVCLKLVQVSLILCVCQSHPRVSAQIQVSVQVQVCLKLCVCQSSSSAPEALLYLNSKFVSSCVCSNRVPLCRKPCSVSSPTSRQFCVCQSSSSAPEALLDFKSKFVSSCVCANRVPVRRRPCSVSSQTSRQLCVCQLHSSTREAYSISSPTLRQLCVCQSRSNAWEALLDFKSNLTSVVCVPITFQCAAGPALFQVQPHVSYVCDNLVPVHRRSCLISSPTSRKLCVCQSRSNAPEVLLDFKSNFASVVCVPITFQCAGGPARFQVQACVTYMHDNLVTVRWRTSSLSSPSSRQLCVHQSRSSAPEALLDFKSNLAYQQHSFSVNIPFRLWPPSEFGISVVPTFIVINLVYVLEVWSPLSVLKSGADHTSLVKNHSVVCVLALIPFQSSLQTQPLDSVALVHLLLQHQPPVSYIVLLTQHTTSIGVQGNLQVAVMGH
jgi:hypothetical protein